MKKIGLIVPYDHTLLSIGAILDVMEAANRLFFSLGKDEPFRITVFQTPEQIENNGSEFHGYSVKSVRSNLKVDLVFIPALATVRLREVIDKNSKFIPWLKKQFGSGAEIASFCTGAFLLAASGLLDGRQATTHVDACCSLTAFFPKIHIKPGQTVTVDDRCYTSGGATAIFHLLILLIQKYCGDEAAVRISKYFAVDVGRYKQSHFSIFRPDYFHNDNLVKEIQKSIEANYSRIATIEEVIKEVPSSRRNIVRRFKHATGLAPIEYLQHIRIESAKKLLEHTNLSIAQIVTDTGYIDPKSFRKIFNRLVGISPLEYRDKFKIR